MITDLSSFTMSANCLCTGGPRTVRQLHTLNKTMLQQAILVPPGYTSLLYAHGYEDNGCPYNAALFKVSGFAAMHKTDCSGEARLVLHLPSSS